MPKLYVANVTGQVQQFTYWLPDAPRHFIQEVPIGGQTLIAGKDLPVVAIEKIVQDHEKYGLLAANEALRFRGRNFSGIVYSLDKPVPVPTLQELVAKHRGYLHESGREFRQQAAVAADDYIQDQMFRQNMPGRLQQLEMSVEEVDRDQRDESPEVSEGVRVTHEDERAGKAPPRRSRARRSSASQV